MPAGPRSLVEAPAGNLVVLVAGRLPPSLMLVPVFGLVTVRGRSMEPALRDGDVLLVRWSRRGARPGRIGVVRLPDRPLSVKRLAFRQDGGWWVERDSKTEGVDSWLVGAVPEGDLLGLAILRLTPSPGRIAGPSQ